MADFLKILILNDDEARCVFLSKVVGNIEETELSGVVPNGRLALARLKQVPVDIVLLDVEKPHADGINVLEKLHESNPDMGVILVGAAGSENSEKVVRALQLGALDFINIGADFSDAGALALRRRLVTLIGLVRARRNARLAKQFWSEKTVAPAVTPRTQPSPAAPASRDLSGNGDLAAQGVKPMVSNPKVELLAIGVSTGGPNALAKVIPMLPGDLGVPVLIVQHMPANMTAALAESLNKKSALRVREAVHGEKVLPNVAYIASGGAHMVVTRDRANGNSSGSRRIQLTSDPPVNSCRPSVDVLFRSIAAAYEGTVLAVIMTGMGSDGMEGVRLLKQKSCLCLTQTKETCVVYGMPRAVTEAGLSDEEVPLDLMTRRIVDLVSCRNQR